MDSPIRGKRESISLIEESDIDQNSCNTCAYLLTDVGSYPCSKCYRNGIYVNMYQPKGEQKKRTRFDKCCESIDNLVDAILSINIGWSREQIVHFLREEIDE